MTTRPVFDPDSVAGQRISLARIAKCKVLYSLYGYTAFAIVTDDESAIGLGLVALRRGRSGAEVARGLADYLATQEARKQKAAKDKRNAQARARRAKKKAAQEESAD